MKKTIKQLWDETPTNKAILDEEYQLLCKFVELYTARSIKEIATVIPGFWDMTCKEAIDAVNKWISYQNKYFADWLAQYKYDRQKKFIES